MSVIVKKILKITLVMYLTVGVISFFIRIPINKHRMEINEYLNSITEDEVEIKGHISFAMLPRPKLILKDVWHNNEKKHDELLLKLKLWPLLKGQLHADLEPN